MTATYEVTIARIDASEKITLSVRGSDLAPIIPAVRGRFARLLEASGRIQEAIDQSDQAERSSNGGARETVSQTTGEITEHPECPRHHIAMPSRKGGLYCPHQFDDGTYCTWKTNGKNGGA